MPNEPPRLPDERATSSTVVPCRDLDWTNGLFPICVSTNAYLARYLNTKGFKAECEAPLSGNMRADVLVADSYIIEAKEDLAWKQPLQSLKEKLDKYYTFGSRYETIVVIYGDARADLERRLKDESRVPFELIILGRTR